MCAIYGMKRCSVFPSLVNDRNSQVNFDVSIKVKYNFASQGEQNGANFSFMAFCSEEILAHKEI